MPPLDGCRRILAEGSSGEEECFEVVRREGSYCFEAGVAWPRGINVVERSTPEKSAPIRSVSRRIVTFMSAPAKMAPLILENRKFVLRRFAHLKLTPLKLQRKSSTPLTCASVRSAPDKTASVMSALRRSAPAKLAREVRARQLRAAKNSPLETRALQNRAGQVHTGKVCTRKICARKICADAAGLTAMEFQVRIKNLLQATPVHPYVSWSSQTSCRERPHSSVILSVESALQLEGTYSSQRQQR